MKKKINKKIKPVANSANKKAIKKIKSVAKLTVEKTKVFMENTGKKVGKEAGKMAKALQKRWDKAEPGREKYKKEVKIAAKKAGARGMELLKSGLKNSMKIGGDIVDVIKKDVKEMSNEK